jgi:hypothetical protein
MPVATGASLNVGTGELLGDGPAAERTVDAVAVLLGSGGEVTVRLGIDGSEGPAASRFVAACGRLGRRLAEAGVDSSRLSLTVDAAAVSPMLAWQTRRCLLGAGRVDFMIGRGDFAPSKADVGRTHRRWSELWRLRTTPARTAFWPEARSACALLASEPADALLPPVSLQAPRHSAWLVYALDIDRLPAVDGQPRADAIAVRVQKAVDDAGERFDDIRWPSARQAQDAWFNRRIGIRVNGIGNVVRRCRLDPGASETFVALDSLLSGIRRTAFERARSASARPQLLPAVVAANPCSRFAPGTLRDAWETRWRQLVDRAAISHRNLIVMSPWSLFPDGSADADYAGLLPLLRHADACAFDRRPRIDAWNLEQFVDFHRRAWGLYRQSSERPVVAEEP